MELKKYSCLVVDDEPIARKILIKYIEDTPLLQLAGECINAWSTIDHLRAHPEVEILFLDINMPNLSGLQLLKIIQPQQPVVFTTAYSEYAVESYELNAVDYLLKPFSFERFTRAACKAIDAVSGSSRVAEGMIAEQRKSIYLKSGGKNYPVFLEEILYCEAMKNYTVVVLRDGRKLTPLVPLSRFEAFLSEAGGEFIQVHRSFLISRKHITAIRPGSVTVDKVEIPVGVQFRERFFKAIGMT